MRRILQFNDDQKKNLRYYFFLLVICLVAYWPISLNVFSVKNDAIHYFLPYRFQISEALRNGELPLWSPYLYLGYPVHGDMQSGAWNPLVWLFSLFGRYDLSIFHYENLLYIFLGGIGMFRLSRMLTFHAGASFLVGCSYMMSGFMLGGQLVNWLAAGAFIPFVIYYFLRARDESNYSLAVMTGIFLYLLFTCAYPSFFILTSYLLLMLFLVRLGDMIRQKTRARELFFFLKKQGLILVVFTALSLPALVSFIDLLPYYQRGDGISYAESTWNSFEWQHVRTLFFPSASKAADLVTTTDLTCRNIYIGALFLPLLIGIPPPLKRRNILLALLAVFSLLFSLGDAGVVRKLSFDLIPLMDTFRHPSQARVFLVIALLLLVAPSLKKLFTGEWKASEQKRLLYTTAFFFLSVLVITVLAFTKRSFTGLHVPVSSSSVKLLLESSTLDDVILVNGIIQLFFLGALVAWIRGRKKKPGVLAALILLNVFVFCQLLLPATFVSQTPARVINQFIRSSPPGFPVAGLDNTLEENSADAKENFEVYGLSYFYNKKIGISRVTNSPSFLEQQEKFISSQRLYDYLSAKPVVYLADSVLLPVDTLSLAVPGPCNYAIMENRLALQASCGGNNSIAITGLSANSFEMTVTADAEKLVVLTQNHHPAWKVTINRKEASLLQLNGSFMGVRAGKGTHYLRFSYYPATVHLSFRIQLLAVLLLLVYGSRQYIKRIKTLAK